MSLLHRLESPRHLLHTVLLFSVSNWQPYPYVIKVLQWASKGCTARRGIMDVGISSRNCEAPAYWLFVLRLYRPLSFKVYPLVLSSTADMTAVSIGSETHWTPKQSSSRECIFLMKLITISSRISQKWRYRCWRWWNRLNVSPSTLVQPKIDSSFSLASVASDAIPLSVIFWEAVNNIKWVICWYLTDKILQQNI